MEAIALILTALVAGLAQGAGQTAAIPDAHTGCGVRWHGDCRADGSARHTRAVDRRSGGLAGEPSCSPQAASMALACTAAIQYQADVYGFNRLLTSSITS
jgi:hypothetical protein